MESAPPPARAGPDSNLSGRKRPRSGPKAKLYIGVSQYKRTGRWEAHCWAQATPAPPAAHPGDGDGGPGQGQASCKGRQLHLGSYLTPLQAARNYDRAVLCLRGAGAETNFPAASYEQDPVLMALLALGSRDEVLSTLRKTLDTPEEAAAAAAAAEARRAARARPRPARQAQAATQAPGPLRAQPRQRPARAAAAAAAAGVGAGAGAGTAAGCSNPVPLLMLAPPLAGPDAVSSRRQPPQQQRPAAQPQQPQPWAAQPLSAPCLTQVAGSSDGGSGWVPWGLPGCPPLLLSPPPLPPPPLPPTLPARPPLLLDPQPDLERGGGGVGGGGRPLPLYGGGTLYGSSDVYGAGCLRSPLAAGAAAELDDVCAAAGAADAAAAAALEAGRAAQLALLLCPLGPGLSVQGLMGPMSLDGPTMGLGLLGPAGMGTTMGLSGLSSLCHPGQLGPGPACLPPLPHSPGGSSSASSFCGLGGGVAGGGAGVAGACAGARAIFSTAPGGPAAPSSLPASPAGPPRLAGAGAGDGWCFDGQQWGPGAALAAEAPWAAPAAAAAASPFAAWQQPHWAPSPSPPPPQQQQAQLPLQQDGTAAAPGPAAPPLPPMPRAGGAVGTGDAGRNSVAAQNSLQALLDNIPEAPFGDEVASENEERLPLPLPQAHPEAGSCAAAAAGCHADAPWPAPAAGASLPAAAAPLAPDGPWPLPLDQQQQPGQQGPLGAAWPLPPAPLAPESWRCHGSAPGPQSAAAAEAQAPAQLRAQQRPQWERLPPLVLGVQPSAPAASGGSGGGGAVEPDGGPGTSDAAASGAESDGAALSELVRMLM